MGMFKLLGFVFDGLFFELLNSEFHLKGLVLSQGKLADFLDKIEDVREECV